MGSIMHSQDGERPPILEHVAGNLRRLRQEAGLSQEALAGRAGVSRRMLVNIERGDANVSLATLDRLAAALAVLFVDLVRSPDPAADRGRIAALAWAGAAPESRGTLLTGVAAAQAAELWLWSLGPGDRYASGPDPTGWQDMVYVLEGRLHVEVDGTTRIVEAGDFHAFPTDRPFAYVNPGPGLLRFLRNVVY